MQTTNDIRTAFLDYFAAAGHEIVPSSPLVPRNDPTLLFTNAGMVQFKNVFTGVEKRPYQRATTSQKCVRAGGKHNDLENVGYTARHHTFFEMLGNSSFGDYFKERAIELAWNLVVREFGLNRDRLLVTVYAEDNDAARLWAKIAGLPESKIIRIATSDNFWAMGDTGPCGPCSEIFWDHGENIPGGPPGSPDQDGDRFIEIWNLVFMQFEQQPGGERAPLPRPSIDTGMRLERIAAVLQGKHENYHIDLRRALITASAEASGLATDGPHAVSHRVIADHLRASSFLIADGVLPSKEGRGYVLRRIMRRAMRHAHLLGCKDPLMWRLVPALVQQMGAAFPELLRAQPLIAETLRFEEANFKQTLERGLRLLEEQTGNYGREPGPGLSHDRKTLNGSVAFVLYDTYGFPLDLTEDILRGHGMRVDTAGFDSEMGEARERSRASWVGSGEAATETAWFALREELGATEFLGYETETAEGVILALVKGEERVPEAQSGGEVNSRIGADAAVRTRLLSPEHAVAEGALALFGEKYGEEVRVVAMGEAPAPERSDIPPYSVELCGGIHVRRTGDIGLFKIVGESSVASGVRRIEALTGAAAETYVAQEEGALHDSAAALRTSPSELPARLARLLDENRRLERELAEARRALAVGGQGAGQPRDGESRARSNGKQIGAIAFDGRLVDDVPGRDLRSLADDLKRRIGSGIVVIVSRAEGKAAIVVGVTPDLTDRFDAVELVRAGAAALGGKGGGGRPDMAQAGGPDIEQAEAALAAVERVLTERVGVAQEIH